MNNIKLLYFSASYCGPCKMFKPVVEQFAADHSELVVEYISLDDESRQETTQYNIRAVPTCIILKDGKEVTRFSGARSKTYLEQQLDEAII